MRSQILRRNEESETGAISADQSCKVKKDQYRAFGRLAWKKLKVEGGNTEEGGWERIQNEIRWGKKSECVQDVDRIARLKDQGRKEETQDKLINRKSLY